MGLVTFEQAVQVAIEDIIYARSINCIRHLYTEIAEYFVLPYYDDERLKTLFPRPASAERTPITER